MGCGCKKSKTRLKAAVEKSKQDEPQQTKQPKADRAESRKNRIAARERRMAFRNAAIIKMRELQKSNG